MLTREHPNFPSDMVRAPPTTWTIIQTHGPNHLVLRCNALPEHRMALITSGLCALQATILTAAGALVSVSVAGAAPRAVTVTELLLLPGDVLAVGLTGAVPPTAWTITRHDGPNHLGLLCDLLPEHQWACITSDRAPSQCRCSRPPLSSRRTRSPRGTSSPTVSHGLHSCNPCGEPLLQL